MVLQLGALREALIDAGADPGKADLAAEELAGYDGEFASIRIAFEKVHIEFARVNGELSLVKWMTGTTLALVLAVAVKLFIH
jgi:hypothetical protein